MSRAGSYFKDTPCRVFSLISTLGIGISLGITMLPMQL